MLKYLQEWKQKRVVTHGKTPLPCWLSIFFASFIVSTNLKIYLSYLKRQREFTVNRYAPCLSPVFQFEFRDEKQKEFANALLII